MWFMAHYPGGILAAVPCFRNDLPNKLSSIYSKTSKIEIADYLNSNEWIAENLNAILEEGNDPEILAAITGCF